MFIERFFYVKSDIKTVLTTICNKQGLLNETTDQIFKKASINFVIIPLIISTFDCLFHRRERDERRDKFRRHNIYGKQ